MADAAGNWECTSARTWNETCTHTHTHAQTHAHSRAYTRGGRKHVDDVVSCPANNFMKDLDWPARYEPRVPLRLKRGLDQAGPGFVIFSLRRHQGCCVNVICCCQRPFHGLPRSFAALHSLLHLSRQLLRASARIWKRARPRSWLLAPPRFQTISSNNPPILLHFSGHELRAAMAGRGQGSLLLQDHVREHSA